MRSQTKHRRRSKRGLELPTKFKPRVFADADSRFWLVKELRKRCKQLMEDVGADSIQKKILCEEAVFLASQIETMRTNAAEGKEFDTRKYTSLVKCMGAIFSKLGLDKKPSGSVSDLQQHLEKKYGVKRRA
jgi:hypothetical protein